MTATYLTVPSVLFLLRGLPRCKDGVRFPILVRLSVDIDKLTIYDGVRTSIPEIAEMRHLHVADDSPAHPHASAGLPLRAALRPTFVRGSSREMPMRAFGNTPRNGGVRRRRTSGR